ncbi:hypothetical protein CC86DRAFT_383396 [Ophiobolus disseminans]|uniref:Uncharacterized protein n=1 Tax=Ophiobolus disseminans TaxID=1469910 RepID=A0A6A6ZYB8_9PLEO|nr:hypothetical protein CC86DRAFT_383396 [Ophiobolus disseminans]
MYDKEVDPLARRWVPRSSRLCHQRWQHIFRARDQPDEDQSSQANSSINGTTPYSQDQTLNNGGIGRGQHGLPSSAAVETQHGPGTGPVEFHVPDAWQRHHLGASQIRPTTRVIAPAIAPSINRAQRRALKIDRIRNGDWRIGDVVNIDCIMQSPYYQLEQHFDSEGYIYYEKKCHYHLRGGRDGHRRHEPIYWEPAHGVAGGFHEQSRRLWIQHLAGLRC